MSRLRNRIVKAEFWTDPELLRWPLAKRVMYQGLWAIAEDSGCIEDDPFGWKLQLFPSPVDIDITVESLEEWRDDLVASGKVIPYRADGKGYLFIRTFHQHERPRNPQRPDIPLPTWVKHVVIETKRGEATITRNEYQVDMDAVPSPYCDSSVTLGSPPSRPVPSSPVPILRDSLSDAEASAAPKRSAQTVSAARDDDWQARADAILADTAFPQDYRELADLMAAANKSGKVTLSRVVRELYEPLRQIETECSRDAMRAGLRAAITKGAPNANYVHKAAASHAARPAGAAGGGGRVDALDVLQQVYDSCEVAP